MSPFVPALTWTDVPRETGFLVQQLSGSTWTTIATLGTGVTTFTDTGLQPGVAYSYRIAASNAVGDSAYSSTVSFTIIEPTADNDSYTSLHDRTLTTSAATGVLANDADAYGLSLSATLVGEPTCGTVSLQANGSFTYTPPVDWVGTDSFTYQDCGMKLGRNWYWSGMKLGNETQT